jgi:hypothetical protein
MSGIDLQNITKRTWEAQSADRVARNNRCTAFPRHGLSMPTAAMPTATTPDERRALALIAAELFGCLEHLLVARGFSVDLLAGLVRSGLADVRAEPANSDTDTVFRLRITERGRQALW